MKLIGAAAAITCGLPFAVRAADNVQFYGKLYPEIVHYSLSGGTNPGATVSTLTKPVTAAPVSASGTTMESSNSYIGFRGSEDLGGGTSAIFQLEGAIGVDDGTSPKSVLFNRDTFVGLSGNFGTLKLGGRMDTVYKRLADDIGLFGVSSGNFVSASNILAQGAFGSSGAERFHERPTNTVLYASPEIGGFQGLVGYSLGEVPSSTSTGSITSVGAKYEGGPLYLAIAHEEHIAFFGGSNNLSAKLSNIGTPDAKSNDASTRITAAYRVASNTRVEVDIARTELEESGGAIGHFKNYRHNSWLLSGEHKIGAWAFAGALGRSQAGSCALVGGAACNTNGLEATMVNLGAAYTLSKRTKLFALYSKMRNGDSANISNASGGPAPAVGQDLAQFGTGLSVSF